MFLTGPTCFLLDVSQIRRSVNALRANAVLSRGQYANRAVCYTYIQRQAHSMQFAFPICHGLQFQDRLSVRSDRNWTQPKYQKAATSVLSGSQTSTSSSSSSSTSSNSRSSSSSRNSSNSSSSSSSCTVDLCRLFRDSIHFLVLLTQNCSDDKIEKNEMGGAYSTYGGEERRVQGFWWGNLRRRDHLGDPGVDGRIILRRIFRMWDGGKHGLD
jgi:hypothetical protein